jgi:hypothetical protein
MRYSNVDGQNRREQRAPERLQDQALNDNLMDQDSGTV